MIEEAASSPNRLVRSDWGVRSISLRLPTHQPSGSGDEASPTSGSKQDRHGVHEHGMKDGREAAKRKKLCIINP
jgi:hypothetical protein